MAQVYCCLRSLSPCFHFGLRPRFELRPHSPTTKFPDIAGRGCLLCQASAAFHGFIFSSFKPRVNNLDRLGFRMFANCPDKNKGFHPLNNNTQRFPQCLTCKFPARMWLICSSSYWSKAAALLTAALGPGMLSHLSRRSVLTTPALQNSAAKFKLTSSCI